MFKGDLEVDMDWEIKGDSKGDLLSRSGQVKVRTSPGLVQVNLTLVSH